MNDSQEQPETDHTDTSDDSDDESVILDEKIVQSSEVILLKDFFHADLPHTLDYSGNFEVLK